jgi:hypothetical protein
MLLFFPLRKDRLYNEFTRADYISSALWASQAA